jgi:tRNA U34 2-thiouridine synthase MnmA/TrmU
MRSSWCRAPTIPRCIASGSRAHAALDPRAEPAAEFACTAKVRYRQPDVACRVAVVAGGIEVRFDQPLRGAAPGSTSCFMTARSASAGPL